MNTINQQLDISLRPRNSNIRSKMARGANDYQVQLGTEDPSLDFYNDVQSISNYHNANGWNSGDGEFNNFLGVAYPPCVNLRCKNCKNECKTVKGLKWRKGGKECHKSCVLDAKNSQMDRIRGLSTDDSVKSGVIIEEQATMKSESTGISTTTKVVIGIGVLALLTGIGYLVLKK